MTRSAKVTLLALFLGDLIFVSFVAQHRFIDADEGSYALAARLVLSHKTPYRDFFYNQAPLLPYVYAGWMKCWQISWLSARTLAAFLTSVLGALVFTDVYGRTRSKLAAAAAGILFTSSTLVFAWFPIVKTYSLAGLLLFGSYILVEDVSRRCLPWRTGAAGLLFGLSVATRSYLLLLAPVFVYWIFKECRAGDKRRLLAWSASGFLLGTLPASVLFLSSPDAFLFNNLGYHAIRSSEGLVGWWWEKFVIVLQLFLGTGEGNGLQWSILVLTIFGIAVASPGRRRSAGLATWLWLALCLISLFPTPAYVQYFSLGVPFLIVSAVSAVSYFYADITSRREKAVVAIGCAALITLYLAVSISDLKRYLVSGDAVPGVKAAADKSDWKQDRVIQVSRAIDQIAQPAERVASFWPGDIFQSTAEPVSGLENPFALPISGRLTAEQRAKYHIVSLADIEASFAAHTPCVVVVRDQIISPSTNQRDTGIWATGDVFKKLLLENGYLMVSSIGGITIYSCSGK